jgi:hypothetical protein
VMIGRTTRIPGVAVIAKRCRPGDSDDDGGGGGGMVVMAKEERDGMAPRHDSEGRADGAVPKHGDGVEEVGVVMAWTLRRRRGHRKFWQSDGVQVKILRLVFQDRAARGFIGGP